MSLSFFFKDRKHGLEGRGNRTSGERESMKLHTSVKEYEKGLLTTSFGHFLCGHFGGTQGCLLLVF